MYLVLVTIIFSKARRYVQRIVRMEENLEVLPHNRELKCLEQRRNVVVYDEWVQTVEAFSSIFCKKKSSGVLL